MTDPRPPAAPRPYDPERGLRGAMSAVLVLEAITVLLSIPVARNTGSGTGAVGVLLICLLAAAMVALCAFVSRPWFLTAAFVLQGLTVLGWFINPSLGVMGVVFAAVWALLWWFRQEFRRRQAAGTLPVPPPGRPGD
ncbi:DUF4233 domain-containing protein [Nakamurella endophytica]|uniref:DUF4233 domain-containing protein n=1 Tax=Nakamurella endophytica TaxID=1748367 RepID=A0A917SL77_9ACTN|nr:DUF4233 domain-containing protein [Nakamurella endophytica]GGL84865.1 hypothetical protein GCM10011594_00560 [Nakamurella endophytica]